METSWRLFGDFSKSPVGLGDVAATKYVFEEEDVSATSPIRLRDLLETKLLRKSCDDVSATSQQRRGDVSATRMRCLRVDD